MKIITPGRIPVEKHKTWIFKCPDCGCVFKPEANDYCVGRMNGDPCYNCPACDALVRGKMKIFRKAGKEDIDEEICTGSQQL